MTHNNPKLTAKIALYQPDIPQNTASIIRTCSCLGVKLEIIEPCGFTFHDKRFRRVVMDYLDEKMIKIYENSDQFFEALISHPDDRPFIRKLLYLQQINPS